jgi:hypothetical protein
LRGEDGAQLRDQRLHVVVEKHRAVRHHHSQRIPAASGTEVSIAAGAGKRTLSGAADGMVVIRSTGQSLASPAEELDFG